MRIHGDYWRFPAGILGHFATPIEFLRPTIAEYSVTQRDAYATVNLRIGLQGEKWAVTAFALNLTDEKYIEEAIPAIEFGGTFAHPNARRRAGLEVTFNF